MAEIVDWNRTFTRSELCAILGVEPKHLARKVKALVGGDILLANAEGKGCYFFKDVLRMVLKARPKTPDAQYMIGKVLTLAESASRAEAPEPPQIGTNEDVPVLPNGKANVAAIQYRRLPPPKVVLPEASARAQIVEYVRLVCRNTHLEYQDAFNMVYAEFNSRYSIDLSIRAEGESSIEKCARLNKMDELYAVARFVLDPFLPETIKAGAGLKALIPQGD